jgi:hypothetical protein
MSVDDRERIYEDMVYHGETNTKIDMFLKMRDY